MRKTKLEKGITLIALIITIVVLLIIAVVAIGAVQESGIIAHAQNAASTYKTKADEEDTILDGYLATIEENLPGEEKNDSEPVSIVGIYGNANSIYDWWEYYKFDEGGTGEYTKKYVESKKKNFIYTLEDGNGTITMEDNEVLSFTFEFVKDASGSVLNKVIIVDEWKDGTFCAYTTNEIAGLPKIDGTIYNGIIEDGIETVSLQNGKCIVKYLDEEETSEYGYFKLGDYIYIEDGNAYFSAFKIIGNEVKNLCS